MTIGLSVIQNTFVLGHHVRLDRYQPCERFLQKPRIVRKARVTIPTASQLHNNAKKLKFDTFHELPTGTNIDDMDWKCTGLGTQPILDIPNEFKKSLKNTAKDWYTTQYRGNTSVWYSILFGLDPEFITRSFTNQKRCVCELKQQMSIELDDYYQKFKYRQYGYMKSKMDRLLAHEDEYHPNLGHYLTDFLGINVMVLLEGKRYHWVGRYDEGKHTLLIYHKGVEWGSLVHPDQVSHILSPETVAQMIVNLSHVEALDASRQHSNLVLDDDILNKLKRQIKAMKLKDLQDRAMQLELLIHDDYGKKKLKRVLQQEIYTQLTGCEDL